MQQLSMMQTVLQTRTHCVAFGAMFLIVAVMVASLNACTKSLPLEERRAETGHAAQHTENAEKYYTCPMHPSVRSDRPGACPVCGMALVKKIKPVDADRTHDASLEVVRLSPRQRVLANVSVVVAERREISNDITAVGVVSYAEPQYRRITSRFPARIEKLYISYTGQRVNIGDAVAEVYSPEAITAQQEYLLALESFEQAQAGGGSFIASAEQLLEQSRQKLLQWGFTSKQLAQLNRSRSVAYAMTVYSPVEGIVMKKNVDPQQYIGTGEDLFEIADLSRVWIYLDVYEKDIRFVAPHQRVRIKTEVYPFETFEGKVTFIDPLVDPETRTIRVRTEFENRSLKLKPNMFVTATIHVPTINAVVVPSSAVVATGKRDVVWVEVQENTFEPRDVVLGVTRDGQSVILNGLEEGERVAATGGFLLDSESTLQKPSGESSAHGGHGK